MSPHERLAELAALVTEIAERAAIGWSLYRDASAVDSEIADDWNELQLLRHGLVTRILGDLPAAALADGLTRKAAIDTAWTIASPDSYDLLVHRLGYELDEFRNWMKQNAHHSHTRHAKQRGQCFRKRSIAGPNRTPIQNHLPLGGVRKRIPGFSL